MVRTEKIIPDDLLKSLQIYLKAAKGTHSGFFSDPRGFGGGALRNDPIMVMVHQDLVPIAELMFKIPLRRSYCSTIIYAGPGMVPKRTDKPHEFSFDVCIDNTEPEMSWQRQAAGEGYILKPGEGIIHDGYKQEHWRGEGLKLEQRIIMAFFHFVDKKFDLTQ